MKILVTGGLGFIGSNLIKRLVAEGHSVDCIDDLSTGTLDNKIDGCTYHIADCNDINQQLDTAYDVIFHLAALARIQASFIKPYDTYNSNTSATHQVLEYARKHGSKVVYAGSSSKWHNPRISPYALSKFLGEELCKMYEECYGMKVQIARFYNVYGPNEIVDGDYAAVIGIWRKQVRDNQPITIIGDGEQRRDFTHVDHIVDGLIRIMNTEHYLQDAWELGTGVNYSMNEVAAMFVDKFNCTTTYLPDQKGNYRTTLRERDVALELLNWMPTDKLKQYINGL
jgi:UDP-glucose 4-epimerase